MESRKNTLKVLSVAVSELKAIEQNKETPIFGLTTVNIDKILKIRRSVSKNQKFSKSMSVSQIFNRDAARTVAIFRDTPKLPKKFSVIDWDNFLKRKF